MKHYYRYVFEDTLIEIILTFVPACVLIFIAFPLKLLYLMDTLHCFSFKIIIFNGHMTSDIITFSQCCS